MRKYIAILTVLLTNHAFADRMMDDPCFDLNEKNTVCTYTIDKQKFIILPNGKIEYLSKSIPITLPAGYEIEEVVDGVIVGDTAFIDLAITDSESGSTIIASISLATKKLNWQAEFHAFNASPLLIVDNEIYIGGIGKVAKYNAATGKQVWQIKDLYENNTQAYNAFNKPYISLNNVIFPEYKVSTASYAGIRSVVVNRKTGVMVSK